MSSDLSIIDILLLRSSAKAPSHPNCPAVKTHRDWSVVELHNTITTSYLPFCMLFASSSLLLNTEY